MSEDRARQSNGPQVTFSTHRRRPPTEGRFEPARTVSTLRGDLVMRAIINGLRYDTEKATNLGGRLAWVCR